MTRWAMVIDLNKCLGCQACAVACKITWTSRKGADHMWWNIVSTMPGPSYPKDWLRKQERNEPPQSTDYEVVPEYPYGNLIENPTEEAPKIIPVPTPTFGPNWYEDVGVGKDPKDNWYFYLPLQCMHCDDPSCVKSCPAGAIYKREDGIVMIDSNICMGFRSCQQACPYYRIFWNTELRISEKCNFCALLVEQGIPPVCVSSCPARARFFGDLDDETSQVYVLVKEYKVAVPLLPEVASKVHPNVFYIPPVLDAPKLDETYKPMGDRYDKEMLVKLFGDRIDEIKKILLDEREKARKGMSSKLIDTLTSWPTWKLGRG